MRVVEFKADKKSSVDGTTHIKKFRSGKFSVDDEVLMTS